LITKLTTTINNANGTGGGGVYPHPAPSTSWAPAPPPAAARTSSHKLSSSAVETGSFQRSNGVRVVFMDGQEKICFVS